MNNTRAPDVPEGGGRSLSLRVLDAIAAEEGASPLTFEPPLFDVADPDALDRIFADEGGATTVEFAYLGYLVTVHGADRIEIAAVDD